MGTLNMYFLYIENIILTLFLVFYPHNLSGYYGLITTAMDPMCACDAVNNFRSMLWSGLGIWSMTQNAYICR
jgi:hypothetical protein